MFSEFLNSRFAVEVVLESLSELRSPRLFFVIFVNRERCGGALSL